MFSKKIATLILGLSAALLTGCEAEQTEKDMIAEAQFCLDKARDASSAQACMSKIDGVTSANAYALRCAAGFISSGITTASNLSQALTALSEDGTGPADMLNVLNFGDVGLANQTTSYCIQSQQKGLQLISALAKSATALAGAANSLGLGSCSTNLADCDAAAIENVIDRLLNPATDPQVVADTLTAVGSSIQTVYTTTCGGTSSANTDICDDINQAAATAGINIATADLDKIGEALLMQWNSNP